MSQEARVKSLVAEIVHTVNAGSSVQEAAAVMVEKDVGCLLVSGIEGPIGIVTERDILRKVTAQKLDPGKTKVRAIMSTPLIAVDSEMSVGTAARKMVDNGIKRLAVLGEDGSFQGLITMTDIVKWMAKEKELSDSLINYLSYAVP